MKGGHVESYDDPLMGKPYDYGVNSYTEYGNAKAFFERFNVSISTPSRLALTSKFADFDTGVELEGYESPPNDAVTAALGRYLEICEKYEHLIAPSYEKFPEKDIPEELLMKFGEFVAKHQLEALVPRLFQVTGMGLGGVVDELTLFVMQIFGAPITRTFLGLADSFTPTSRRNQDIYDEIAKVLDKDVLYSSTVVLAHRDDQGVQLLVHGADRKLTLISAKKLLISFSPTMENIAPFLPDPAELEIFTSWGVNHVYAGIVTHPALPENYSFVNYPSSVVPSNWIELPRTPYVVRYEYMGGRNFRTLVTGTNSLDFDVNEAQSLAKETFKRLLNDVVRTVNPEGVHEHQGEELEIIAWADHTTIHPHVSADKIRNGFFKKLYDIQGHRSTFYTGGAFAADFSTFLWEYNDQYLLPKLVSGLVY